MYLYSIQDLEHLEIFIKNHTDELEMLKKRFHEANGRGYHELAYFMGNMGTAFQVAAHKASEASRISDVIPAMQESGKSEGEIIACIKQVAKDRLRSSYQINLASRSTSPSANLEQDSVNQFYLEIISLIEYGER